MGIDPAVAVDVVAAPAGVVAAEVVVDGAVGGVGAVRRGRRCGGRRARFARGGVRCRDHDARGRGIGRLARGSVGAGGHQDARTEDRARRTWNDDARWSASPTTSSACFTRTPPSTGCRCAAPPSVRRDGGRRGRGSRSVSALRVGERDPQLVFIHGGAQNAHTWDTVLIALGAGRLGARHRSARSRPLRTGATTARTHRRTWPTTSPSSSLQLAPDATAVVGHVAGRDDVDGARGAPSAPRAQAAAGRHHARASTSRRRRRCSTSSTVRSRFPSFESLLERTMEHNPTRTESSLRRGILHNAHQLDDGSWQWRYDRSSHTRPDGRTAPTHRDRRPQPTDGDDRRRCGTTSPRSPAR